MTDDPVFTVLSVTRPKARVDHECCYVWCKRPIKAGEVYERIVFEDEHGEFQCLHRHLDHWPQG